jgi:membrane associated rhomboid family serine protease
MAFRSNSPISLVFPPFRGVTRRIILIALCAYLGLAAIGLFSPDLEGVLRGPLVLSGKALHPLIWQFVTYPFVGEGLLSVAFAMLSIWFFGSALEDERGSLWMTEYFLTATIGGGVVASLLSRAAEGHIPGLGMGFATAGLWPAVLAVLVAYARFHAEDQINFSFLFTIKAKYIAAIYVLFYLALALIGGDRFGALVALCNALAGYGFLRLAPRRGFRVGVSERWFALRNSYYRAKRRRAAKKFTVYMRKQGKDVSLDEDGRYVDPEGKPRDPNGHDPNDKRWMN